jgi:hypothetical protein
MDIEDRAAQLAVAIIANGRITSAKDAVAVYREIEKRLQSPRDPPKDRAPFKKLPQLSPKLV